MTEIIKMLLEKEPYKSELSDYKLVNMTNFNNIKKGSNIKYINLNEELKNAGTYVKSVYNGSWRKSYILIMSGIPWKLKYQTNWIFYKENITLRDVLIKLINE